MNINDPSVWLSYNVIAAVAQRPYDLGVGSAFHPMKIHIHLFSPPKLLIRMIGILPNLWALRNSQYQQNCRLLGFFSPWTMSIVHCPVMLFNSKTSFIAWQVKIKLELQHWPRQSSTKSYLCIHAQS